MSNEPYFVDNFIIDICKQNKVPLDTDLINSSILSLKNVKFHMHICSKINTHQINAHFN